MGVNAFTGSTLREKYITRVTMITSNDGNSFTGLFLRGKKSIQSPSHDDCYLFVLFVSQNGMWISPTQIELSSGSTRETLGKHTGNIRETYGKQLNSNLCVYGMICHTPPKIMA